MKTTRRQLLVSGAALAVAPTFARAQAQWPSKPISLTVGYAPGGTVDFGARVLAEAWKGMVSVPVTVENRAGAAGTTGGSYVVKSVPDGHSLLVAGQPETAMLKSMKLSPPYETLRDLIPVALLVDYGYVLVFGSVLKVKTWADVLAYAKAKGEPLTYATAGVGTTAHLMTEQLVATSGLKARHVPYAGASAFKPDLIAGRVDFTMDATPLAMPFIREEKVTAVAITLAGRDPKMPTVPTFSELGVLPGEYTGWIGLFAPRKTPDDVVQRIRDLTIAALKGDAPAKILAADYRPGSPTQPSFDDFVKSEESRWGEIVKRAGLTPT